MSKYTKKLVIFMLTFMTSTLFSVNKFRMLPRRFSQGWETPRTEALLSDNIMCVMLMIDIRPLVNSFFCTSLLRKLLSELLLLLLLSGLEWKSF